MKKKLLAQNLVEGILIMALVALGCVGFVTRFNLNTLKGYIFNRPVGSATVTTNTVTGNLSSTELTSINNQISAINASLTIMPRMLSGNGAYQQAMMMGEMNKISNALASIQSTLGGSSNTSTAQQAAFNELKAQVKTVGDNLYKDPWAVYSNPSGPPEDNHPSALNGIKSSLSSFQTSTTQTQTTTTTSAGLKNTITIESMTK